jgi:hypothetical protein
MTRSSALRFLSKYKWFLTLAIVGIALFYWYEIRPIRVYRDCAGQASMDARNLLQSKAELAKGTENGVAYATLVRKNMYLRSDYESFLQKCLLYHGLPLPADMTDVPAASSAASSRQASSR